MVNVKQKRCAFPTCANRPSFNHAGAPSGVYCSKHKAPGMVRYRVVGELFFFSFGERRDREKRRKEEKTHFLQPPLFSP